MLAAVTGVVSGGRCVCVGEGEGRTKRNIFGYSFFFGEGGFFCCCRGGYDVVEERLPRRTSPEPHYQLQRLMLVMIYRARNVSRLLYKQQQGVVCHRIKSVLPQSEICLKAQDIRSICKGDSLRLRMRHYGPIIKYYSPPSQLL